MNKIIKIVDGNEVTISKDLADYLCVVDGESISCELINNTIVLKKDIKNANPFQLGSSAFQNSRYVSTESSDNCTVKKRRNFWRFLRVSVLPYPKLKPQKLFGRIQSQNELWTTYIKRFGISAACRWQFQ